MRLVCREILAPGDHVHTEREADSRNLRANIAEAEHAARLPVAALPHRELPAAGTQMCVFQGDLTHARKDERPGHLDGGACIVSRMRNHDISLGPRLPHRWPRCEDRSMRSALVAASA